MVFRTNEHLKREVVSKKTIKIKPKGNILNANKMELALTKRNFLLDNE